MKDISKSPFIPACILIELAVVGAHLDVLRTDVLLALSRTDVLFESTTAAQVRNLGLCHTLAFLGDEHFKCRQVPLLLDLFLLSFLLCLDASLNSLDVAL